MELDPLWDAHRSADTDLSGSRAEFERPQAFGRVAKGVVLAAGVGARLGGYSSVPKMLQPLLGVPLVERAVRTLLRAGIEKVIVVYGAHPEVGDFCRATFGSADTVGRVEVIYAPRWAEGNGASLAAAERYFDPGEPFVSVSGDHFISQGAIEALMRGRAPSVLVDTMVREGIDAGEATKVLCDSEGRVVDIGKDVSPSSDFRICLDAGAHLLTPEVFSYLSPRRGGGEVTVSSALRAIARKGCLWTVAVPEGCSWQDIDTASDLRWAKKKALRDLRSPKDGIVARTINRPLSLAITSVLARFRPSPNWISGFALLLAVLASIAAGVPRFPAIVAAILIQLVSIVDGVDGEIARANFSDTRFGRLLDGVLDRIGDSLILIGVALRAPEGGGSYRLAMALLGAAVGTSLLSMSSKDRLELVTPEDAGSEIAAKEKLIGNLMAGRDGRLLVLAVAVAFGIPLLGLGAVACVAGLGLIIRLSVAARILGRRSHFG